jgi:hypothetical protein
MTFSIARELSDREQAGLLTHDWRRTAREDAFSSPWLNGICPRFVNNSNGCCTGFSPVSLFVRRGQARGETVLTIQFSFHIIAQAPAKVKASAKPWQ